MAAERGHGLGGGERPRATRFRVFFTCAANTLLVMRHAWRLRLLLLPSYAKFTPWLLLLLILRAEHASHLRGAGVAFAQDLLVLRRVREAVRLGKRKI